MMTRVDGSNTKPIRKAAQFPPLDVLDLAGEEIYVCKQKSIEVVVYYKCNIDVSRANL
jgi:hypothetical protein